LVRSPNKKVRWSDTRWAGSLMAAYLGMQRKSLAWSRVMKIAQRKVFRGFAGWLLASPLLFASLLFPVSAAAAPPKDRRATIKVAEMFTSEGQQFSCSIDYSEQACLRELSALREHLAAYHAENLGRWTWILVSSTKWKPLSEALGALTTSPAMTSYVDRQTLFEESLFLPSPADALDLTRNYHLPLKDLVIRTLTHELGHAYCGDPDEARTELLARQIRRGIRPSCSSFMVHALEKTTSREPGK
jgi:hypothetical protein